ncbi:hypothetical protein CHS0354_039666 [Potamilus streckersoni]|uniref:Uncharacterized protein n=1 Tax=Potamilus streckersoni TaxID=2493646 RepID=A0AAE0SJM2_9BIVA|nr:hypothetical protein CHS0354_039666 [Potamilus streckersoni]
MAKNVQFLVVLAGFNRFGTGVNRFELVRSSWNRLEPGFNRFGTGLNRFELARTGWNRLKPAEIGYDLFRTD